MHKIAQKSWSEGGSRARASLPPEGIFRAYDIRGIYPEEINEDAAYKIARAFARYLRLEVRDEKLEIVVSSDARESSPALKEAFSDGLSDEGAEIIDAGLTTTPMHYFILNKTEADGGAMITASHNPPEFNGMKLSKKSAVSIGAGSGMEEIKNDSLRGIFQNSENRGSVVKKDFSDEYTKFLAGSFPHLKSYIIKFALADKIPGESFDFDGDRVMFRDESGKAAPGDMITALLARKYAKPGEKIIYDIPSSRAVREEIEAAGGVAVESRVGHSFVKALMKKENAVFGGELSGHYYFRDFFYSDSGIFAALAVLDLLRETKKPLSELIKPLARYFKSEEINFKIKDKEKIIDKVAAHFTDGKASYSDGIKIEYPDWWFNLRPSNTEDLLRLNIEASTSELLEEKRKILADLIMK
ncbi:MAG: phosphomannomutase/phosphoglucomutase [Candidatus Giovannonibacteria bacterium]|nr:MAG: phosphomannomutase/phosphoglucomutase [Candidatus Giovannonibacteria bacterium]